MLSEQQINNMSVEELEAYERQLIKDQNPQSLTDDELDSLTIEELEALEKKLNQQETKTLDNRYTDLSEYYEDRLQRGLTATPSMAYAAYQSLVGIPLIEGKGYTDSFEEGMKRFGENYMVAQNYIADTVGMDLGDMNKKAPNTLHKYAGTGVEFMADPFGALWKTGVKLTNLLSSESAKKLAGREATLFTMGTSSEIGGDVGAEAEKAITGTDKGIGRTLGSFAAPFGTSYITKPVVQTGFDLTKKLGGKVWEVKSNPQVASDALATTWTKNILKKIKAENPDIDTIVKDLEQIGIKWDAGNFPLIAAASEGTAKSAMIHLAKTNSTYRDGFLKELRRVAKLIEDNADQIFGKRYAPISEEGVSTALKKRSEYFLNKRIQIDERIEKLQEGFEPTMSATERGKKIANLVEEREALVRKEMKPEYKKVEDMAANVTIPKEAVSDLWNFIKKANVEDLFATAPKPIRDAFKALEPVEVLNNKGRKIVVGKDEFNRPIYRTEFRELTFKQFDSLKRAVNRFKRERNLNPDEARKLATFENEIGFYNPKTGERTGLRSYLPENIDVALRDVDRVYYEKIGIPFDVEAIAQIGRKRYFTEVSDVILKNRESVEQFINVGGKPGEVIARDAMNAKILKESIDADGVLDGKKFQKSLRKNKDVIDSIPGMRDEVATMSKDASYLFKRMATLDDALKIERKKVADNFIVSSGYAPNYRSLIEQMINTPKTRKKILNDVKKLDSSTRDSVLSSIRREFIESLQSRAGGAYEFLFTRDGLVNPSNRDLLTDLFGKQYVSDLKDFARVVDILPNIDAKKLNSVILKENTDIVSKTLPGVDLAYLQSAARDRISSIQFRIARVFSKMQQFKTGKDIDRQTYELLMDPDGMKKFTNATAGMEFGIKMTDYRKLLGTMRELFPVYIYGGAKGTTSTQNEPINTRIQ